jgi:16S rRNA (guanine(527)-N(7))-methyltransferase RsmG
MLTENVRTLLDAAGIPLETAALEQLSAYVALVREFNDFASLVSIGDAQRLEEVHLPDSLSLAPLLHAHIKGGAAWIDVGSGGGLPAIPLKIVLPQVNLTMVERSVKKAGVLRQMLERLGIKTQVVSCQFPQEYPHPGTRAVLTARAVERAADLHRRMGKWTRKGDVFFCQAADISAFAPAVFHVEQWEDDWSRASLRRGKLWIVERR